MIDYERCSSPEKVCKLLDELGTAVVGMTQDHGMYTVFYEKKPKEE